MERPAPIDRTRWTRLIGLAREEDFGTAGDLTSHLLPPSHATAIGTWRLVARESGWFCGSEVLPVLLAELAPEVRIRDGTLISDGRAVEPGTIIAELTGRRVQLLTAERVLLNFLQRLSGVCTLTRRFVAASAGTHAKIFDTRKTTPGWRDLERYAVRCGGGHNHRAGLHDAVLIKDNHLAGVPIERLAHTVFEMLNKIESLPVRPQFVEVEVDGLEPFREVLKVVGIQVVLLDNFEIDALREAVRIRDDWGLRGKVELEASGGVTLDNVRRVAHTGVERIAVGALTHSAAAVDLALDAVA